MADKFSKYYVNLESPLTEGYLAVPNNSQDLPNVSRAIHCNIGGTASVIFYDSNSSVTLNLVEGAMYPYRIKKINAVGTTAQIVVMF